MDPASASSRAPWESPLRQRTHTVCIGPRLVQFVSFKRTVRTSGLPTTVPFAISATRQQKWTHMKS